MRQILEAIPGYLKFAPREEINRVSRKLIEAIIASPNGKIVGLDLH